MLTAIKMRIIFPLEVIFLYKGFRIKMNSRQDFAEHHKRL